MNTRKISIYHFYSIDDIMIMIGKILPPNNEYRFPEMYLPGLKDMSLGLFRPPIE